MTNIIPTKHSLGLVEKIAENMYGGTYHHHFHILYDIRSLIEKEEINYFEIGTHYGASSCLMLSHPMRINVYTLDLPYFPCGDASVAPDYIQKMLKNLDYPKTIFN